MVLNYVVYTTYCLLGPGTKLPDPELSGLLLAFDYVLPSHGFVLSLPKGSVASFCPFPSQSPS